MARFLSSLSRQVGHYVEHSEQQQTAAVRPRVVCAGAASARAQCRTGRVLQTRFCCCWFLFSAPVVMTWVSREWGSVCCVHLFVFILFIFIFLHIGDDCDCVELLYLCVSFSEGCSFFVGFISVSTSIVSVVVVVPTFEITHFERISLKDYFLSKEYPRFLVRDPSVLWPVFSSSLPKVFFQKAPARVFACQNIESAGPVETTPGRKKTFTRTEQHRHTQIIPKENHTVPGEKYLRTDKGLLTHK